MELIHPHSAEAEASYLGYCLLNQMSPECPPDDFFANGNRIIAQAMIQLGNERKPIEAPLVYEQCCKISNPPPSMADIAQFLEYVPSGSENADHYLEIIQQNARLRRLQQRAVNIVSEINDIRGKDSKAFLQRVERELSELFQAKSARSIDMLTAIKLLDRHVEEIRSRKSGITGITCGIPDIDRYTCGWSPEDYIVLAARPSMGKTAIALDFARSAARKGHHVLFVSLEMGARAITMRMVSQESRLNSIKIRSGSLSDEEMAEYLRAGQKLSSLPIIVEYSSRMTELDIAHSVRRHRPELLLVDYAGFIQCSEGGDKKIPRERQVSIISGAMKAIAREHRIPVILLSQLNRENEKSAREPRLSDLRESGALEQDADMVVFLHAPKKEDDWRDLIIAKNRNGPCGRVKLRFNLASTSFSGWEF